jgi:tRNA dimethylallyltransferase
VTRVVAVVGPTAAGKSELGVVLARALGGEVVNADSMQLYRGMDIGTAKLSEPERAGIPHHMLDIWDVREAASVAEYQRMGRTVLDDLATRGVPAIVVGGSGLYVRALLDDLVFPGTDADVRARLESQLADMGPAAMHQRLASVDPEAATSILPSNGRRIVRALEVIEITGGPFIASLPDPRPVYDAHRIGLVMPREDLDARIEMRVQRMWQAGLADEVRHLEQHGLREGVTASRALGYAQVLDALAGEITMEQAQEETVRATRRFARRQESWFRRDPHVSWIPAHDAGEALDRARDLLADRGVPSASTSSTGGA